MCVDIITRFTIALSILSVVLAFVSLVFAMIYLVKILKVEKTQEQIKDTLEILDIIKVSLIQQAVHFGPTETIPGSEIIKKIQEQFNCDDWEALKLLYTVKNLELK